MIQMTYAYVYSHMLHTLANKSGLATAVYTRGEYVHTNLQATHAHAKVRACVHAWTLAVPVDMRCPQIKMNTAIGWSVRDRGIPATWPL